jgi:predicted transcriptional regulator
MVQVRLNRLIKNGFIRHTDGRYALTSKGRRLHQVFSTLRRFFRHDPA